MKPYLKSTFIAIALFFSAKAALASGPLGSHIGYKAIDSVTYEVTLTVYRDCNGLVLNTPVLSVLGKSSGVFTVTMSLASKKDVTGKYLGCNNFVSRCSGNYRYGIEEYIYTATVNVSGGACTYRFSYDICCRNGNISTGAANSNMYNYATLNKCYGTNNTPQALTPLFIIAVGQDQNLVYFSGDTTSRDSISYRLVDALSAFNTPVVYASAWSSQRPITFIGFPNTTLLMPAGFHLNNSTSELSFRPTVRNQVSVFCVEATEWRKVNGTMQVAGTSIVEQVVTVDQFPTNKMPAIKGQSVNACADNEACITVETTDADASDSTFLDFFNLPTGATVTKTRTNNGKRENAKICWTPTKAQVSNIPYQFTAVANDGKCDVSGRALRAFTFTVVKTPDSTMVEVVSKVTSCNSAKIIVQLKNNPPAGSQFFLTDEDGISTATNDTALLLFKGSGWKKFYVTIKNPSLCSYTLTDSVFITLPYTLQLTTIADSTVCVGTAAQLYTNALNGKAPYQYLWQEQQGTKWQPASTASNFTAVINAKTTYSLFVLDSNNCNAFDTVVLDTKPLPIVTIDPLSSVCANTNVSLTVTPKSGVVVSSYTWRGIGIGQTINVLADSTKTYSVTALSPNGCTYTDSTKLSVLPIGVDAGTYPSLCDGKPMLLTANATAGANLIKYTWVGTGTSSKTLNIFTTVDTVYVVKIEDGFGCIAYDTAKIFVHPPFVFAPPPSVAACPGTSVSLSIGAISTGKAPYTFEWDNVFTGNTYTTTIKNNKIVSIVGTDANNCEYKSNVQIIARAIPIVSFGAKNKTVCEGIDEVLRPWVFGATSPYSFLWSDGSVADSLKITINAPQRIQLTATDVFGCKGTDSIAYSVFPRQGATLTPISPLCIDGTPVALKATPNTGKWSGQGVTNALFVPQVAGAGKKTLSYTYLNASGCNEVHTIPVSVLQFPVPNFVADKTIGLAGTVINFTNTSVADTVIDNTVWDMGEFGQPGNIITTKNALYTYNKNGEYTVKLTVYDGICPPQTVEKKNHIKIGSNFLSVNNPVNNTLAIYPNPASQEVMIEATEKIISITVYNVIGQQVYTQSTADNKIVLNTTQFESGVYSIVATLGNGSITNARLVIAK